MKPRSPFLAGLLVIAAAGWIFCRGCAEERRTTAAGGGGRALPGTDESVALADSDGKKRAKLPRKERETEKQRAIRERLQRVTYPYLDFEDVSPAEAIDFFRQYRAEGAPKLPLIVRHLREGEQLPPGMEEDDLPLRGRQIKKLMLRNVPVWDSIHFVAEEAGLRLKLTDKGLEISSAEGSEDEEEAPAESTRPPGPTDRLRIRQKMQDTVIPLIDFEDVSADYVFDFLRAKSRELDADEEKRGINVVIRNWPVGAAADLPYPGEKRIPKLRMENVSLWDACQRVAAETGLDFELRDYAVILKPK